MRPCKQLQRDVCQGEASRAQGPVPRFEVENLYERVPCRVEKRRSPFGPRGSIFPNQGQTPGFRREEREVRVDGEHASLSKGRLTGHQFEPLFEASIAELEAVGLGKTPRELYLSYLRKMPPHLQKEIRADKRLWPTDETPVLRAPRTWEESHKVVLEFEQREAAHKAVANAVYTASSSSADPHAGELADTKKELAKLKAEVKAAAKAAAKASANQTFAAATKGKGKGGDADKKICFHFRDHGNCPKGDSCPYSHDKELRKRALASRGGPPADACDDKGWWQVWR